MADYDLIVRNARIVTAERHPLGLRVDFTRPGELAPVRSGFMTPGSAILYLTPAVAQQFGLQ